MAQNIVILEALRTPIGAFQGSLSRLTAAHLAATAMRGLLSLTDIDRTQITDVLLGNVLSAGQGQAPARQALRHAGLADQISATLVNKVCASGMQTLLFAHQQLMMQPRGVVLAGGMESMSNAPYLNMHQRRGHKFGAVSLQDHLMRDGLEDATTHETMGLFADRTAKACHISREVQDNFAIASYERAIAATDAGHFTREIVPLVLTIKGKEQTIADDECRAPFDPEKIRAMKPVFDKEGTITAANASGLADGAACVMLSTEERAKALGLPPRAHIKGFGFHGTPSPDFTQAPIGAIQNLLQNVGWSVGDVDLFDVNEAFSTVPLLAMAALNIPHEKMNVLGGACALGHPLGASGARIVVTLLNALEQRNLKRGVAAVCVGGGEGLAIAIERP